MVTEQQHIRDDELEALKNVIIQQQEAISLLGNKLVSLEEYVRRKDADTFKYLADLTEEFKKHDHQYSDIIVGYNETENKQKN